PPPRWPSSSTPHDQRTDPRRMPQAHAGAQARAAGRAPAARPRQVRPGLPLQGLRRLACRLLQRLQAAGAGHPHQPPDLSERPQSMTTTKTEQALTVAAPRQQFDLSPQTFEQALTFSKYLADSDLVPKD